MRVAIIDYGMGNLGSVSRALEELGTETFIADRPERLAEADRMILPGVGNFGEGMSRLNGGGWSEQLHRSVADGKPLLGICLGMQLLVTSGTEGGDTGGLNFIPGRVQRLDVLGCKERIPHVGWNSIVLRPAALPLFSEIPPATDFYFVHSFAVSEVPVENILAEVNYGVPLVAAIGNGRVFGTQFHPEKSSRAGFRILKSFLDYPSC